MSGFETTGKKYWENFGKSFDFLPRQYFDFISKEEYEKKLEAYNLIGKKVIDIGAGFPSPLSTSLEKRMAPLASESLEVLEEKGAKVIPVDVSLSALRVQQQMDRDPVGGCAFQLPFKDKGIDGGAVILNLFNSSYAGEDGRETYIKPDECEKILREIFRVMQRGSFAIINSHGYTTVKFDDNKIIGPELGDIISMETINELSESVGFKLGRSVTLDLQRKKLGEQIALESFPEGLREQLSVEISDGGGIVFEK